MDSIKLLIIHNHYRTANIGGEDFVFNNELNSLTKLLGSNNVFSYQVSNDSMSKFKILFSIWFSFKHYAAVKKIIEKEGIDIAHVHNFYPMLTPSIFKAANIAGAKVIHTLHNYRLWCISGFLYRSSSGICELCVKNKFPLAGIFNRCIRSSLLQSFIVQASFCFYKLTNAFNYIDYYFVLTNFQKNRIKSFGVPESKILLKPNSIEKPLISSSSKDGYIFVGRMEASKGILKLLSVWVNLDRKFKLTLVGEGELYNQLKHQYNQENINFIGKLPRDRTLELISNSKYLIQPSLWYETFGLTIIEAMSLGTPVIGLDIGTRREFIENEKNGFLCVEGALAEVIVKSYNHSEYSSLCSNATITAKSFLNDLVLKKQINLYKKILLK